MNECDLQKQRVSSYEMLRATRAATAVLTSKGWPNPPTGRLWPLTIAEVHAQLPVVSKFSASLEHRHFAEEIGRDGAAKDTVKCGEGKRMVDGATLAVSHGIKMFWNRHEQERLRCFGKLWNKSG